jgi:hypothetical protein
MLTITDERLHQLARENNKEINTTYILARMYIAINLTTSEA